MPLVNLEFQKKFGASGFFPARNIIQKFLQESISSFLFSKGNHGQEKHAERNKEMLSRIFKFHIDYFC